MKVLMFGWEFPPHISGGLGTACYGMTKGLAGLKEVEVIFVVPKIRGDEYQSHVTLLGADQVQVIRKQIQFSDSDSKMEYYELRSELIPYLGSNEFYELKSNDISIEKRLVETTEEGKIIFSGDYGRNLFQEIQYYAIVAETLAREIEFDVIHVHDWMTFPAGIAVRNSSGKPLVVHIHSTEFDRSGSNVNPAVCTIEREGLQAADQVFAVSDLTRNKIIDNYYIRPEKVITVYNAVEPSELDGKVRFQEEFRIKTVSFLGRITMQKGPEYFIEAARLVLQKRRDIRFVMAGKGDLREAMIRLVAELNISDHFEFPGFLEAIQVTELFHASNVFVMPSVSEPFGIVALEAMQAGLPVVISKQSGVSEILKNAIKVDYWDSQSMAEAIITLLDDSGVGNKLSKAGKKEVSKLVWRNTALQILDIYRSFSG